MKKIFIIGLILMVSLSFADPVLTWVSSIGDPDQTPYTSPWLFDEVHLIFTSDIAMDKCYVNIVTLGQYNDTFSREGTVTNAGLQCELELDYLDHHYNTAYGIEPVAEITNVNYTDTPVLFLYKSCGVISNDTTFDENFDCRGQNGFYIDTDNVELNCGGISDYWGTLTLPSPSTGLFINASNVQVTNCIIPSDYVTGSRIEFNDNVSFTNVQSIATTGMVISNTTNVNIINSVVGGSVFGLVSSNNTNLTFDYTDVFTTSPLGVAVVSLNDQDSSFGNGTVFGGEMNVYIYSGTNIYFSEFEAVNATSTNVMITESSNINYDSSYIHDAPINVHINTSSGCDLRYDTIYNSTDFAVLVNDSDGLHIYESSIYDGDGSGIVGDQVSDSMIIQTTEVYNFNDVGIELSGSVNRVNYSEIYDCFYGIYSKGIEFLSQYNNIHDNRHGLYKTLQSNFDSNFDTIYNNEYGLEIVQTSSPTATYTHFYNNTYDLKIAGSVSALYVYRMVFDNPLGNYQNYSNVTIQDGSVGAGENYAVSWDTPDPSYPYDLSFNEMAIKIESFGTAQQIDVLVMEWTVEQEEGYYVQTNTMNKYESAIWSQISYYSFGQQLSATAPNIPVNGQVAIFNTIPGGYPMWSPNTPANMSYSSLFPITLSFYTDPYQMDSCTFDLNIGNGYYIGTGLGGVLSANNTVCTLTIPLSALGNDFTILTPDGESGYYRATGHAIISGNSIDTLERVFDYQGCGILKEQGATYTLGKGNYTIIMNAPNITCLNITADDITVQLYNYSTSQVKIQGTYPNGSTCYQYGGNDNGACSNGYGIYAKDVDNLQISTITSILQGALEIEGINNTAFYLENIDGLDINASNTIDVVGYSYFLFNNVRNVRGTMLLNGFTPNVILTLMNNTDASFDNVFIQNVPDEVFYAFGSTPYNTVQIDSTSSISGDWYMGLIETTSTPPLYILPMFQMNNIEINGPRVINSSNMYVDEVVVGGTSDDGLAFENVSESDMKISISVNLLDTSDNIPSGNFSAFGAGFGSNDTYGGAYCSVILDSSGNYHLNIFSDNMTDILDGSVSVGSGTGLLESTIGCDSENDCEIDCHFGGQMLSESIVVDEDFYPKWVAGILDLYMQPDHAEGEIDLYLTNFELTYFNSTVSKSYLNGFDSRWKTDTDTLDITYETNRLHVDGEPHGITSWRYETNLFGTLRFISIDTTYLPEFNQPATLTFSDNGMSKLYSKLSIFKLNTFSQDYDTIVGYGTELTTLPTFIGYITNTSYKIYQLNVTGFSSYGIGEGSVTPPSPYIMKYQADGRIEEEVEQIKDEIGEYLKNKICAGALIMFGVLALLYWASKNGGNRNARY